MKLIVGLGNPGTKYKSTFHNVGWMVVDKFCDQHGLKFKSELCDAKVATGTYFGEDIVVAKPLTFMNLSGESVKQLVKKYGIDVKKDLIVIYDDLDLDIGSMRIREVGSAGTHNGMRNIVKELNTQEFVRLRVGTKTQELKDKEIEVIDFVLSKIDYQTKKVLEPIFDRAVTAVEEFIEGVEFQRIAEKANVRAPKKVTE